MPYCLKPYMVKAEGIPVPCGKCLSCRINRSTEWGLRAVLELAAWDYQAVWLGLSYDPEHLPENGSIRKKHLQDYIKRVRGKGAKKKVKYFGCGEYGETTSRPHYHLILYGISQEEIETVKEHWHFGYVKVGTVTYESARYTAGYQLKKWMTKKDKEEYVAQGLEAPFQISSNGFGLQWCLENQEILKRELKLEHKGKEHPLPRYFRKKLDLNAKSYYDYIIQIKEEKLDEWIAREKRLLSGKNLTPWEKSLFQSKTRTDSYYAQIRELEAQTKHFRNTL